MEYRDYQKEVIDKACNIDRGIIRASTGSGKTPMACAIIARRSVFPTIFYVSSIDLLLQAKSEIEKFIRKDGMPVKVGELSGSKKDIQDITVMTIQTAVRSLGGVWVRYDDEDYRKEKDDISYVKKDIQNLIYNAKLIICDEVQHWAAETCQIISDASRSCQYRYGISATPFRDLNDDILIEGCFGKVIADVPASLLIKRKYLVKPIINFIYMDNMKGQKYTSYPNVYKRAIVENDLRNDTISQIAIELLKQGRKILILCKHIAHGKDLEKRIPNSVFLHGAHSSKKRKKHLEQMRKGEASVTISSVIFDEGIDCKPLDTLILAGSGKSSTRALQRIGRVIRPYPGKTEAIVIDFIDNCRYLKAHSLKREKMYMTEPEFVVQRYSTVK